MITMDMFLLHKTV